MHIREFLHAEFISAMKKGSKSYDFREKCQKRKKKNRKIISFGNFY